MQEWQTTNVTRWAARTGIFIPLRKCATHWQQFLWTRLRLLFGRQLFDFRTHLMNSFLLRQKPFNVQHQIYRWTENFFQRLLSNEINCLSEHFELKDYGSHRIEESVLQSNWITAQRSVLDTKAVTTSTRHWSLRYRCQWLNRCQWLRQLTLRTRLGDFPS